MMGQQQQTVAGSALRRIILALAIAAVMATMAVAMAAPAFAAGAYRDRAYLREDKSMKILGIMSTFRGM